MDATVELGCCDDDSREAKLEFAVGSETTFALERLRFDSGKMRMIVHVCTEEIDCFFAKGFNIIVMLLVIRAVVQKYTS